MAARRAKVESHPRTTRSQASKGFFLGLGREARGAAEHRGDAAGVQSARARERGQTQYARARAGSGGRSTEAGCDSCRHVTRGKGSSVNSKATRTGRPKSRSCSEVIEAGSRGLQPLCSLQSHCDSQARAKCSARSRDEGLVCTPSLSILRITDTE